MALESHDVLGIPWSAVPRSRATFRQFSSLFPGKIHPRRSAMVDEVRDLNLLGDALDGARGTDQQRIARVVLQWGATILRKNADYGSSVWKTPVLAPRLEAATAILVRMSDKVERLARHFDGYDHEVGESVANDMGDLGSYCLLWLARPAPKDALTNSHGDT